jgi:nitrogen fixation/metabolism regulation signal transduction histidine kinase
MGDQQSELVRAILACAHNGIVVADTTGRYIFENATAERLIGLGPHASTAEIASRSELYGADGQTPLPINETPLARALRGEAVKGFQVLLRNAAHPEGVLLSINAHPWSAENGSLRGAVAIFQDVTAEKLAERELFSAERLACLSHLAAGVAHEINNPLAVAISSLTEIIEGRPGSDLKERQAAAKDLRESLRRIKGVVSELRLLSQGQAGELSEIDLGETTQRVLSLVCEPTQAPAKTDIARDLRVRADEVRLAQLVHSMLLPHLYEERAPTLVVRCFGEGARAKLEIKSEGTSFMTGIKTDLLGPALGSELPAAVPLRLAQSLAEQLSGRWEYENHLGSLRTTVEFAAVCSVSTGKRSAGS